MVVNAITITRVRGLQLQICPIVAQDDLFSVGGAERKVREY
jgi:hypothetical protein